MISQFFRGINYTEKVISDSDQKVLGTANPDWFIVEGNNNVVKTGNGNDVVLLGRELDLIFHFDTSIFSGQVLQTSPMSCNSNVLDAIVRTGAGDDYVSLGSGNYTISLSSGNNFLDDYSGNYLFDADGNIIGLVPISTLVASSGSGDDIFSLSGFANRTINAGNGNNLILLGSGDANINTGSGNDIITSEISILTYIFDAGLSSYNQTIKAGNGDNQIAVVPYGETTVQAGGGNDFILAAGISNSSFAKIFAGNGNNTIITSDTNSTIRSGSGDDLIFAGSGNDTIYGGNGNDVINLRGETVCLPNPLSTDTNLFGSSIEVTGGGNDTVYLGQEKDTDTVVLGSSGFAAIYGFGCNDRLNVSGLNASFSRVGNDTLISSCGGSLGILKGYTGSVNLV